MGEKSAAAGLEGHLPGLRRAVVQVWPRYWGRSELCFILKVLGFIGGYLT